MQLGRILWVDDEVDSLQSQQIFLTQKGYEVVTFTNGYDAVEYLGSSAIDNAIDVVLLDETMPGMSGLETLSRIKLDHPHLPVVLITKNETENLMNEAIGRQISDYLIKPVNPNQVLLSLKKIMDKKDLVAASTTAAYQQEFTKLFMQLQENPDFHEWMEIYKKLVYWELEMEKSDSPEMREILQAQKKEANAAFFKFISKNYERWVAPGAAHAPIMSHQLLQFKVLPHVEKGTSTFFILIDNLRFDQWKAIQPIFQEYFRVLEEDTFYSILPTATHYCRNAIFSGLLPIDIEKKFKAEWKNDDDEGSKNLHEETFMRAHLAKLKKDDLRVGYHKIVNHADAQQLLANMHNLLQNDLSVIVYNFVDMLSHARTDMAMIKELASDESAYRSLTLSWFMHSPLLDTLKKLAKKKVRINLTTDHGTIRIKHPVKVIGDRNTNTNLRYKQGKNLNFNPKEVFLVKNPGEAKLPLQHLSSSFIFAKPDDFFVYPNNYNHFVNHYNDTFQHGGISLEEMIVPFATYLPK